MNNLYIAREALTAWGSGFPGRLAQLLSNKRRLIALRPCSLSLEELQFKTEMVKGEGVLLALNTNSGLPLPVCLQLLRHTSNPTLL